MTYSLFSLANKRALITGSARGLGFIMARALAEAGAEVVINARDTLSAERACHQLRQAGFNAIPSVFDVTDKAAINQAINTLEASGPIDILVNNAGIQRRYPFLSFPEDEWQAIIAVNQTGVFLVSQAVAACMKTRQQGKIINIGSMQSELGRATITPYAASKGAVNMLTRGMCVELANFNIQVNAIAPGYFQTEMTEKLVNDAEFSDWLTKRTPAGRWGNPDELKGAVVFLASAASSFVNGHTLFVDGGMRVAV